MRATKSGSPSPLRSATGTWIAPCRSSDHPRDELRLRPSRSSGSPAAGSRRCRASRTRRRRGRACRRRRSRPPGRRRPGRRPSSRVTGVNVPSPVAAQPDDAAAPPVGRREAAQVGDEHVGDAVAVEVDDLGVGRVRHLARAPAMPGPRRTGVRTHDEPAGRMSLARQQIGPALASVRDSRTRLRCEMAGGLAPGGPARRSSANRTGGGGPWPARGRAGSPPAPAPRNTG